ncbi:MAG: hypothetical protein V1735_06660 [Nanoarchaeota archaeon]
MYRFNDQDLFYNITATGLHQPLHIIEFIRTRPGVQFIDAQWKVLSGRPQDPESEPTMAVIPVRHRVLGPSSPEGPKHQPFKEALYLQMPSKRLSLSLDRSQRQNHPDLEDLSVQFAYYPIVTTPFGGPRLRKVRAEGNLMMPYDTSNELWESLKEKGVRLVLAPEFYDPGEKNRLAFIIEPRLPFDAGLEKRVIAIHFPMPGAIQGVSPDELLEDLDELEPDE